MILKQESLFLIWEKRNSNSLLNLIKKQE